MQRGHLYSIRYQGEEGWAPALFLKRVDSDEPLTSTRGRHALDIASFNGGMLLNSISALH